MALQNIEDTDMQFLLNILETLPEENKLNEETKQEAENFRNFLIENSGIVPDLVSEILILGPENNFVECNILAYSKYFEYPFQSIITSIHNVTKISYEFMNEYKLVQMMFDDNNLYSFLNLTAENIDNINLQYITTNKNNKNYFIMIHPQCEMGELYNDASSYCKNNTIVKQWIENFLQKK